MYSFHLWIQVNTVSAPDKYARVTHLSLSCLGFYSFIRGFIDTVYEVDEIRIIFQLEWKYARSVGT